jgi:hypothetical protein
VTPRAMGTIARTVVAIFAAAVFGALSFSVAASAQAPAKPSPKATKPPVLTITITGPDVSPPIVIRSTEDPTLYAQVETQVVWMKSATGNVMPSGPTTLGPDYTVTMTTGTTKTAVYDLYPLVAGGPRAHRAAVGSQKAAWFFAPISMASALEAAGVKFPTSSASGQAVPPTVATSAPSTSLSKIMAQSKIALGLAGVAAAAVLLTLGLAARRSRRLDRRRAMPAALARLETVANRARGGTGLGGAALATSGAGLRQAVPAARADAPPAKATGTARVKPPSQPTGSVPDAAPASTSTAHVTGTAAPVPARGGPPISGPGRSGTGQSGTGQPGSGQSGSPAGSSPVKSMPAGPAGHSSGSLFGTPRDNRGSSDQPRGDSAEPDHPRGDARPPAPRAAVDAPVDPPADPAVDTPAEIAVGTAHVVAPAAAAASTAEAGTSVNGPAKVTLEDDRAVGVAPAPRAPTDDVIQPGLSRPYVMLGRATSADSASAAATEPAAEHHDATTGNTESTHRGDAASDDDARSDDEPGTEQPVDPATRERAHEAALAASETDAEDADQDDAEARVEGLDEAGEGDVGEGDVGEETGDGTDTNDSDAADSAAGEPDAPITALTPAVPANSERDHDAAVAGADPAEPPGGRP